MKPIINPLQKIANLLFLLFILILPFFYLPSLDIFSFELSKVLLFQTFTTLLLFLFLLQFLQARPAIQITGVEKLLKSLSQISIIITIFYIWLIISSIFGIDFKNSLIGTVWRRQGLIFWTHGLLLMFFLKTKFINPKPLQLSLIISLSAFIQAIISVYQFINLYILHINSISYAGRIIGTFGQPNFLAGFMLITLPFSLYGLSHRTTHCHSGAMS